MRHAVETPEITPVSDGKPHVVERTVMIIKQRQLKSTFVVKDRKLLLSSSVMKTITTENTGRKVILMEQITTKIKIKAFGITKEILAGREVMLSFEGQTVADLRAHLFAGYPALASLRSLLIAVNNTYAEDSLVISPGDEVALIPPVSGG